MTARFMTKTSLLAGLLGIISLVPGQARADFLPAVGTPTIASVSPGVGGAPANAQSSYTYSILISATQQAVIGDFFTIYDFFFGTVSPTVGAGIQIAAAQPNFTVTTPAFSPSPVQVSGGSVSPNDTSITNVNFVYNGPVSPLVGPTNLVTFTLFSSQPANASALTPFFGRGTDQDAGSKNGNLTTVRVAAIPEPASLVLLGMGLPAALLLRRRSRKA